VLENLLVTALDSLFRMSVLMLQKLTYLFILFHVQLLNASVETADVVLPPGTITQLIYFDGRGRAEQFRIYFADQQIPYNDVRLTGAQFEKLKKTFTWGHVPVVNITTTIPGSSQPFQMLADTAALQGWVGKYKNLWPWDKLSEEVLMDYSSASEDLRLQKNNILGEGAYNATPSSQKQFLPILHDWLFYFERNLGYVNGIQGLPYLLGNLFTPVDCRVWDSLNQISTLMNLYPNLWNNYAKVNTWYNNVASRPNIAKYLKNRPT